MYDNRRLFALVSLWTILFLFLVGSTTDMNTIMMIMIMLLIPVYNFIQKKVNEKSI